MLTNYVPAAVLTTNVQRSNLNPYATWAPGFCKRVGKSESGKGIVGKYEHTFIIHDYVLFRKLIFQIRRILQLVHLNVTFFHTGLPLQSRLDFNPPGP